ncbi:MAG: T9SS type A sorting domain-containing protein [Sporocytophaga sp.]|uniref:T9SS type A sorting domain-containing protein n=1 Tax=Sporocytophaga sp. TaxID=2231183 RepID=UPI001B1CF17A|nr:T9SS type A sorting domain-containing protein [Sporocytophaga sp.]MBO9699822.1 T9SS type A sorting domain-containing protein [Sporocytophaga sp.]
MKNLLMLLLLILLVFQREGAKAGISKAIDGQPRKGNYYNWNYTSGSWEYNGLMEFEYDDNNNLILELYFNSAGDTASKKVYSYNSFGKETEYYSYLYKNHVFIPSHKEIRTYDSKGYLAKFESFSSSDGVSWGNIERTVYSRSNSTLEYPNMVEKYTWQSNSWHLDQKYSNMVWIDFEKEKFSSGLIENGSDQRITYTTDNEGIKKGRVEGYNTSTKSWYYSVDEVYTIDAQGNTTMIIQGDYGGGPLIFTRYIFPVDAKGNDTGYLIEVLQNNTWKFITSELTYNTYNSNGSLTETIKEGKEVGAIEIGQTGRNYKSRIIYEGYGEVTSLGQSPAFSMIPMAYPNPCKNTLNIENVSKEDMEVSLFDMNNHPVLSSLIPQGKGNISIEDIPSGLYLLKATSQSGVIYIQKIVKE